MKSSYKIIVASKAHLAVAIAMVAMVVAGGATFGSWVVSSSAGNGYAKATTAQNLTLNDASASTVADLYPGGSGAVKISVTNPNSFAVTITSVTGAGAVTSDKGAACDASTGVTFTNQTGLSQPVAAGATTVFTLSGAAAMSTADVTSCQGGIFTMPVTLTATT
jgi:hypothetical protein